MVNPYKAIQWSTNKFFVDLALVSGCLLYLAIFVAISASSIRNPDVMEWGTIGLRALATLSIVLLHAALAIGPLSRLNPAFVALIQHRRHLGVVTFLVALGHGVLAAVLHHSGGELNPLASIVLGNGQVFSIREWPFEIFGLAALIILAMLAATSHDFWIAYLSPFEWKRLHMLIYVAYGLVVLHVALGVLQEAGNPVYGLLLAGGMAMLLVLHRKAAAVELRSDEAPPPSDADGFVMVGAPADIPMGRARIVVAGGERIAVFRYWQGISAVSNVCPHQGGPLGEGGMTAGCVRCPWHGSIYFPQSGLAPPPSNLRVHTFPVKLVDGCVWVSPVPFPIGTESEPLPIPGQKGRSHGGVRQMTFQRGVVASQRPGERLRGAEDVLHDPADPAHGDRARGEGE